MNDTTICGSSDRALRIPQRASTLVPATSHNITELLVQGGYLPTSPSARTDVLAVPPATVAARQNRTPCPKPWQPLALSVADPQAAEAVELHVSSLADSEQGIRHESVIAEHRIVEAGGHAGMVLR
jgi:hypothetical protein